MTQTQTQAQTQKDATIKKGSKWRPHAGVKELSGADFMITEQRMKAMRKASRGKMTRNSSMPENRQNHITSDHKEIESYREKMKTAFGNDHLPPVVYKGDSVPKRVLSDYSYLTKTRTPNFPG